MTTALIAGYNRDLSFEETGVLISSYSEIRGIPGVVTRTHPDKLLVCLMKLHVTVSLQHPTRTHEPTWFDMKPHTNVTLHHTTHTRFIPNIIQ